MQGVQSELERALERFRRSLLNKERRSASEMTRVYGETWKQIQAELERLNTEYEAAKGRGEDLSGNWISQFNRARAFRDQVERQLLSFAQYAEGRIKEGQYEAIRAAEANAEALARKALGKPPKGISVDWNRIPTAAVEEMVGLTQADSPLHKLLMSISAEGAKAAEDALIQGLLLGKNPRVTAPLIRDALGISLSRALTIARTETLRAYRTATQQNYLANSDVVGGWVWHSACDVRTCAMCWVMHGTVHRLDETLDDHPNGRCSMVPQTKSWGEIGKMIGVDLSDLPDTRPTTPPGSELFGKLTAEKQIKILGAAKWAAWKEGKFKLSDLVGMKYDQVWGGMRYEKSLTDLIGVDQAKGYTRLALMGVAKNAGNYSADDLIRMAGLGLRELTAEELQRVVKYAAGTGFSNGLEKCGTRVAGLIWDGKVIHSSDKLPTGIVHYLRHVVYKQEWPEGTSIEDYYISLKNTILDQGTKVVVSKYANYWQLGFWGSDGTWVDYRVQYGHWSTGFKPESLEKILNSEYRSSIKWLK